MLRRFYVQASVVSFPSKKASVSAMARDTGLVGTQCEQPVNELRERFCLYRDIIDCDSSELDYSIIIIINISQE